MLVRDKILKYVIPAVSSGERRSALPSDIPEKQILDLILYYRVLTYNEARQLCSGIVTNNFLRNYGISAKELHDAAVRNAETHILAGSMLSFLSGCADDEDINVDDCGDDEMLWVITNSPRYYGAAAAFINTYVLRDIANRANASKLYIFPSSVHEVIVSPVLPGTNAEDMSRMVADINKTEVIENERLADHCYIYDGVSGTITF